MIERTKDLMSTFDTVYKELSKWDVRKVTFDNPAAGLTFIVFLKHISDNKDELGLNYPEKFDVDYLILLYGEKILRDDLIEHIRDIEKQLGYRNGILVNFARELELLNQNTQLVTLLQMIKPLDLKINDDNYYGIYDALANYLNVQSRKELRFSAENFMDVNLAKLMAELVKVQEGMSVYDFASGYSIGLVEAAKGKNAIVYAQDINMLAAAVSIMILTLTMNKGCTVLCDDSLTHPLTFNYERDRRKFDRIVSVPPFGFRAVNKDGRIESGQQAESFEYGLAYRLTGDIVFARHLLATLNDEGIGVLLMPVGVLFRGGTEGKIREQMIRDNYIDAVIELPVGILSNTNIKTALVIFKRNRKNKDIFILDVSRDGGKDYVEHVGRVGTKISDTGIKAIAQLVERREEVEGLSRLIDKDEVFQNDGNLSAGTYLQLPIESLLQFQDTEEIIERNTALVKKLQVLDREFIEIIKRL